MIGKLLGQVAKTVQAKKLGQKVDPASKASNSAQRIERNVQAQPVEPLLPENPVQQPNALRPQLVQPIKPNVVEQVPQQVVQNPAPQQVTQNVAPPKPKGISGQLNRFRNLRAMLRR